ncbi:MAG: ABC transporter ATP-binding protein [Mariniblastus sp.]|nr:ABC transporter ATP-binding protein [Mariniblastus sp.]
MIDISLNQLEFQYPRSDFRLVIEQCSIPAGKKVAIVGPSGSGKTTLLNLLAGIHLPDKGQINLGDSLLCNMSDAERRNFRISQIGMVFQQFELVDYLTTMENILLPFAINQSLQQSAEIREYADSLAEQMGLGDKRKRLPSRLSQGEQQRVAICRALVTQPKLIFADEPTGNLDPRNKKKILDILFQVNQQQGQSLIVVTHDMQILNGFEQVIDFQDFTVDSNPKLESNDRLGGIAS